MRTLGLVTAKYTEVVKTDVNLRAKASKEMYRLVNIIKKGYIKKTSQESINANSEYRLNNTKTTQ